MSDNIDREINRVRSLMHYYKCKPDLLSKCQSEVLQHELSNLKAQKRSMKHKDKIRVFIQKHPEYKDIF